jgi:hypothetical protein
MLDKIAFTTMSISPCNIVIDVRRLMTIVVVRRVINARIYVTDKLFSFIIIIVVIIFSIFFFVVVYQAFWEHCDSCGLDLMANGARRGWPHAHAVGISIVGA